MPRYCGPYLCLCPCPPLFRRRSQRPDGASLSGKDAAAGSSEGGLARVGAAESARESARESSRKRSSLKGVLSRKSKDEAPRKSESESLRELSDELSAKVGLSQPQVLALKLKRKADGKLGITIGYIEEENLAFFKEDVGDFCAGDVILSINGIFLDPGVTVGDVIGARRHLKEYEVTVRRAAALDAVEDEIRMRSITEATEPDTFTTPSPLDDGSRKRTVTMTENVD